jgi:hypothetical protein
VRRVRKVRLGAKSSREWFDGKSNTRAEVVRRCKFMAEHTGSIIEIRDHEDAILYKVFAASAA